MKLFSSFLPPFTLRSPIPFTLHYPGRLEQPNLLPNLPLHHCIYYEGSNLYGILRTRWSNQKGKISNLFFSTLLHYMCLHGFTRTLKTHNILVRKGLNIMKININQYRLRKRPRLAIQRLWSFLATNLNSVVESNFESARS